MVDVTIKSAITGNYCDNRLFSTAGVSSREDYMNTNTKKKKNVYLANKCALRIILIHDRLCNGDSGAAKVDFSPESCILLRKHETLHKCSLLPTDH